MNAVAILLQFMGLSIIDLSTNFFISLHVIIGLPIDWCRLLDPQQPIYLISCRFVERLSRRYILDCDLEKHFQRNKY